MALLGMARFLIGVGFPVLLAACSGDTTTTSGGDGGTGGDAVGAGGQGGTAGAADRWAMAGAAALEASLVPVAEAVSVAETPNRAL